MNKQDKQDKNLSSKLKLGNEMKLNIPGVNTKVTKEDIVNAVRESRSRS